MSMSFRDSRYSTWRKRLADAYESEHGPLPDPVATNGAELITAPSTPVDPPSLALDTIFRFHLQQRFILLQHSSQPTCLKRSPCDYADPYDSYYDDSSSSDSDSDTPCYAPWSSQVFATRMLQRAADKFALEKKVSAMSAENGTADRPRRKRLPDRNQPTRPKRQRVSDQNRHPRKQSRHQLAEIDDSPTHNRDMGIARPKRQTSLLEQRQSSYRSPLQTLSTSFKANTDIANQSSVFYPFRKSKVAGTWQSAQQPTPEADNSSHYPQSTQHLLSPASSIGMTAG